jgi:hypothetical protein
MKIHNKEYRIIKKVYGDGHEEYHAEECILNLFLFGIWKDYIYEISDYGYGSIVYKYRFPTYDECLNYLTENIENKLKLENDKKIISINIFK